ncbi:MAG: zinc ribbon domain-containing protein [Promethearchaeota archaeon]
MMSEKRIDVDLQISKEKFDISLIKIFKDSFKLLKKTILPLLLFISILSFISACLKLLILTDANWALYKVSDIYNEIARKLKENPDLVLSNDEYRTIRIYSVLFFISNITDWSLLLLGPISLLVLSTGKIYFIYYRDNDAPSKWLESIKFPFNSKKRAITSLYIIIFGSIFISIGFLIFILPGVLIIFYGIFSIHALIIDEKKGIEALKGGLFYVRGHFTKLIAILLIIVFIPMLIQYYYQDPLNNFLNLTDENYILWMNPETRNYGLLFIYDFTNIFFQNILYFFIPVVYVVTFVQIRDHKLGISATSKSKSRKEIITVEIDKDQTHFKCPNCGKRLPSSARKCFKCKQLFDVKYKNI